MKCGKREGKEKWGFCPHAYLVTGGGTKACGESCDICLRPARLEERNRRVTDEESFDEDELEDLFSIFRF